MYQAAQGGSSGAMKLDGGSHSIKDGKVRDNRDYERDEQG